MQGEICIYKNDEMTNTKFGENYPLNNLLMLHVSHENNFEMHRMLLEEEEEEEEEEYYTTLTCHQSIKSNMTKTRCE